MPVVMGSGPVARALTLFTLLLTSSFAGAAELPGTTISQAADPRVAQRVTLRSRGIPLLHVLQALGGATGVGLSAKGQAADEVLTAFVPDAPLSEVMESIARLYRFSWTRQGDPMRPTYLLQRSSIAEREETALRRRLLDEALQRITRGFVAAEAAAGDELKLRRFAVDLARKAWPTLLSTGYFVMPVKQMSPADRDRLLPDLSEWLSREEESWRAHRKSIVERLLAEGRQPPRELLAPLEAPFPKAEDCTFVIEARVDAGIEVSVSLRPGKRRDASSHTLLSGTDPQSALAGEQLYPGQRWRGIFPDHPGPSAKAPFDKPLSAAWPAPVNPSWADALSHISDAGGVAIYADHYPQNRHRRDQLTLDLRPGVTAAEALDQVCLASMSPHVAHSWSQVGRAGLVRSRRWLWQAANIVPVTVGERLATSLQKNGTISPADLSLLAALSRSQVRNWFANPTALDAWRLGIVIPSRLSPLARQQLLSETGLAFPALSPIDRKIAFDLGGVAPDYAASLKVVLSDPGSDGERSALLALRTMVDGDQLRANAEIPLPSTQSRGLLAMKAGPVRPVTSRPKQVMALYYPWYGLPGISGSYRHLDAVSTVERKVGNFAHYPVTGPYDSSDPATLKRHVRELKDAGVDVIVCSWWGLNSFEDKVFRKLLAEAESAGLKVCLFVEPFKKWGNATELAADLHTWTESVGSLPGYFRQDNRPVIFLFGQVARQVSIQTWADARRSLQSTQFGGALLVTDATDGASLRVFDGSYAGTALPTWVTASALATTIRNQQSELVLRARRSGQIAVASVGAGFDLKYRTRNPMDFVDRADGRVYRDSWMGAMAAGPDWVLIHSYNQWEVGSEIEPSTLYGDAYLKMTAEFSARFKGRSVETQ